MTDAATAERFYQQFKWSVVAPIEADPLGAGRQRRAPGGGDVSSRWLLGAHLPASFPERRETVAGECLGCQMQFAVDVRLPLPASCPDCGADVLARADIEGPDPPGRPPFNALRIRRTKP